tara:strand:+ start:95 stop:487 length:393 start_codon:yes stop_codon:yes gene_type:complete
MREIDQMLDQWIPVNTIIRKQFRDIITKYIELRMVETFNDARRIYERNPDSGEIRSRESMDYGNEKMVNPAVNSVPNDGVCEGEYVHPRYEYYKSGIGAYPTQEDIIAFNVQENKNKEDDSLTRYNKIKN